MPGLRGTPAVTMQTSASLDDRVVVGAAAGQVDVGPEDAAGLLQVEGLALGHALDDVHQDHVAELPLQAEQRHGAADLSGADERDLLPSHAHFCTTPPSALATAGRRRPGVSRTGERLGLRIVGEERGQQGFEAHRDAWRCGRGEIASSRSRWSIDAFVDPFEQIREERIGWKARQEILVDHQRATFAACAHGAETEAELGRRLRVGLKAVQRVVHGNRDRQVRQREDAGGIGQVQCAVL